MKSSTLLAWDLFIIATSITSTCLSLATFPRPGDANTVALAVAVAFGFLFIILFLTERQFVNIPLRVAAIVCFAFSSIAILVTTATESTVVAAQSVVIVTVLLLAGAKIFDLTPDLPGLVSSKV